MAEISDEMYEQLQQILEKENGRSYTFEETQEIGDELVDFFCLLIELESKTDDGSEVMTTE